jgi:hypothetical protein
MDAHCQRLRRRNVDFYCVGLAVTTNVEGDGTGKGYGYFKAVVFFGNGYACACGRLSALNAINKIIKKTQGKARRAL